MVLSEYVGSWGKASWRLEGVFENSADSEGVCDLLRMFLVLAWCQYAHRKMPAAAQGLLMFHMKHQQPLERVAAVCLLGLFRKSGWAVQRTEEEKMAEQGKFKRKL